MDREKKIIEELERKYRELETAYDQISEIMEKMEGKRLFSMMVEFKIEVSDKMNKICIQKERLFPEKYKKIKNFQ